MMKKLMPSFLLSLSFTACNTQPQASSTSNAVSSNTFLTECSLGQDSDSHEMFTALFKNYPAIDCESLYLKLQEKDFLWVSGAEIDSIKGIEGLGHLTSLILTENNITDISPLRHLTALRDLDIAFNQVESLEPIKDLKGLTVLGAEDNQIASLEPLRGLSQLTTMFLSNNKITSVEPLSNLTASNMLIIVFDGNQVSKETAACPTGSTNAYLNGLCLDYLK